MITLRKYNKIFGGCGESLKDSLKFEPSLEIKTPIIWTAIKFDEPASISYGIFPKLRY
jgi:hypothetical protein